MSLADSEIYESMTDEQLADACRHGEQDAFSVLSVRYLLVIKGKANAAFGGADADDLFQEGLIGLHNAAMTYDHNAGASFRTYASVCISNRIVSAVRSANNGGNRLSSQTLPLSTQLDAPCAPETEPESRVISAETVRELWEKIRSSLSKLEFRVLTMFLEGSSYGEISVEAGISVKACDNAMQRVRRKLQILR